MVASATGGGIDLLEKLTQGRSPCTATLILICGVGDEVEYGFNASRGGGRGGGHDGRCRVSGLQGQRDSKMGNLFE